MGEIEIRPYDGGCKAEMLSDIAAFWAAHYLTVTPEDSEGDLKAWTAEGHELYVILAGGKEAGFLHMGSRGGACDWLEERLKELSLLNEMNGPAFKMREDLSFILFYFNLF